MPISMRSGPAETLSEEIARLVQSRTGGRIHGLTVEVIGRGVTIGGRTDTYYVKQMATHAALDLAGQFATLTNDIAVG